MQSRGRIGEGVGHSTVISSKLLTEFEFDRTALEIREKYILHTKYKKSLQIPIYYRIL
jgi:hypothetical protein